MRADIRSLPFSNGTFDLAFCVSTLDHAGKDNSGRVRTLSRGRDGERGLRELRRVLTEPRPVLISVPTGAEEEHGWSVQHEPARWWSSSGTPASPSPEHEVYAVDADGWRAVPDEAVTALAYGERGKAASASCARSSTSIPDAARRCASASAGSRTARDAA